MLKGNVSKNKKFFGEGGSGSQDFVINVTGMIDETHVTLDKTLAEMNEAYSKGKNLYVKAFFEAAHLNATLQSISSEIAIFRTQPSDNYFYLVTVTAEETTIYTDYYVLRSEVSDDIETNATVDAPPTAYAVKKYVDTAIQTAIGDVLGGAS